MKIVLSEDEINSLIRDHVESHHGVKCDCAIIVDEDDFTVVAELDIGEQKIKANTDKE